MNPKNELIVATCKKYNETNSNYPQLKDKVDEFIHTKIENAIRQFGASDKPFNPDGPLGKLKIWHAHLNRDVSIFYRIKGSPGKLYLYGLFSHKESGTSKNDPNRNIQKSLAKVLSTQFPELKEDDDLEIFF